MTKFFTSLPLFLYFVYLNISIINYTQSLSLIKKKFSIPKPTQNFSNSKKKKIEKKVISKHSMKYFFLYMIKVPIYPPFTVTRVVEQIEETRVEPGFLPDRNRTIRIFLDTFFPGKKTR